MFIIISHAKKKLLIFRWWFVCKQLQCKLSALPYKKEVIFNWDMFRSNVSLKWVLFSVKNWSALSVHLFTCNCELFNTWFSKLVLHLLACIIDKWLNKGRKFTFLRKNVGSPFFKPDHISKIGSVMSVHMDKPVNFGTPDCTPGTRANRVVFLSGVRFLCI